MVSDNLEIQLIWTHVGNPVRIIRIFAIHTGILLPSIVRAISVIVVNIYTSVSRRGVFCYLNIIFVRNSECPIGKFLQYCNSHFAAFWPYE